MTVPKRIRDELGFHPRVPYTVRIVDGHVRIKQVVSSGDPPAARVIDPRP